MAYKLESEQTVQREFSSLQAIADNYPKYMIMMDDFGQENIDRAEHRHIGGHNSKKSHLKLNFRRLFIIE